MPRSVDPASRAADATTQGLGRKLLMATLVAVVVFAGLSLYSDVLDLRRNLVAFDWWVLGAALALATTNYAIRFWRWEYYLRALDIRVPRAQNALIFLAGFSMSVTPGKLGEVFKSLLLYESEGISPSRTAPVVVAERLTDLLALVLLCALGALSFEHGIPVALSGGTVVLGLIGLCAYKPAGLAVIRWTAKIPKLSRLSQKLDEAYTSLRLVMRPMRMFVATGVATISWGLECLALYLIVHGFPGSQIGWEAATFAYSAATIAGALAMMPGGLGVTEVGMTGLLQVLEPTLSPATATAVTLLVRLSTLWFAVVLGLAAWWTWRLLQPHRATA